MAVEKECAGQAVNALLQEDCGATLHLSLPPLQMGTNASLARKTKIARKPHAEHVVASAS